MPWSMKRRRKSTAARALALKGGGEGPAFVTGKAEESHIIQFIQPNSDPHMPPKEQLDGEQIAALGQWIDSGAEWLPAELVIEAKLLDPAALGQLPGGYQPVFALALSPDDKQLAAGHGNLVTVHNLTEKDKPATAKLTGHLDAIQSIAWSADGKRLAKRDGAAALAALRAAGADGRALADDLRAGRLPAGYSLQMP